MYIDLYVHTCIYMYMYVVCHLPLLHSGNDYNCNYSMINQ